MILNFESYILADCHSSVKKKVFTFWIFRDTFWIVRDLGIFRGTLKALLKDESQQNESVNGENMRVTVVSRKPEKTLDNCTNNRSKTKMIIIMLTI